MLKRCYKCELFKENKYFSLNTKNGYYNSRCKSCQSEYAKNKLVRTRNNAQRRDAYSALKTEIIMALGGFCDCCKITEIEFLTIDHIEGGGRLHRKLLGSKAMYQQIKSDGFPKDKYRVLCYNCNCAIGHYGSCPHQHQQNHPIYT